MNGFLQAVITIAFFIAVWAAGTITQYLYWQKVRKLIHGYAKDHVGYLGTGMCTASFSRKAFVLVLTDLNGVINGCYELKSLSLNPKFSEMPEMLGIHVDDALDNLVNEKYHDAFQQAIHAIESSMKPKENEAQEDAKQDSKSQNEVSQNGASQD